MLQYTLSLVLFLVSLFFSLAFSPEKIYLNSDILYLPTLVLDVFRDGGDFFFMVFHAFPLFLSRPSDHFRFITDLRKRTKSVSCIRIYTNGLVLDFNRTILDFCGRRNKTKIIESKRNKTDQILGIGLSVFYTFDDKKISSSLYPIFTFHTFKRFLDFVICLADNT